MDSATRARTVSFNTLQTHRFRLQEIVEQMRAPPGNQQIVVSKHLASSYPVRAAVRNHLVHSSTPNAPTMKRLHGIDQYLNIDQDDDQEHHTNPARVLSGASVSFDEFGHVLDVKLPTDSPLVCITGLRQGTTSQTIVDMLDDLGLQDTTRMHSHH